MRLTASTDVAAAPHVAHAELADLSGYPHWLRIVLGASPATPHPDDGGPAWLVDLGAAVGPFRRAKRVRMVRTFDDPPRRVRFERFEHDGRDHPAWVLEATVGERDAGRAAAITVELRYDGGSLPLVEPLLREEARAAARRLAARLAVATDG